MIILKTARISQKQAERQFDCSVVKADVDNISGIGGNFGKLMERYVEAWDVAYRAGKRNALPRIERKIIDTFVKSGAKLDDKTRALIRSVMCKETARR